MKHIFMMIAIPLSFLSCASSDLVSETEVAYAYMCNDVDNNSDASESFFIAFNPISDGFGVIVTDNEEMWLELEKDSESDLSLFTHVENFRCNEAIEVLYVED